MRGVWKLRFILPLLAVTALLLLASGNSVIAAPFKPRLSASLSSYSPGATADITTDYGWGNSQEFFTTFPGTDDREAPSSFAAFTPASWGIPDCSPTATCPYPIGNKTGKVQSTTTLGLLNQACDTAVPVSLDGGSQPPYPGPFATTPLLNASTDNSAANTIAPGANFLNLTNDNNSTQIMDGAERWNTLLSALGLGAPAPPPRERQVANTNLFGTNVWVDIVTYNPGIVAPAALGYATLLIIENFNPAQPPTAGLITDSCGLSTVSVESGLAANGAVHRSNPTTPGTKFFFINSTSDRDADQGPSAPDEPTTFIANSRKGFVNSDDTCPYTPNVGSPHVAGAPFNGDGTTGDLDGIDSACDPNPEVFNGSDVDGDGFFNRGDNCPFNFNPTQADLMELGPLDAFEVGAQPVDGGPRNDGIGDACDLNPTVADGHFHQALTLGPLCVTVPAGTPGEPFPGAFLDSDSDGYCNLEEVALGSSPSNPGSKPEALAVPTTCSDGIDNDLDGSADLNDGAGGPSAPTGCQLPLHDVAIKKVNSDNTSVCSASNATTQVKFNVLLQNNGPASSETVELGVMLDSVPSYVPSGTPPYAPSKSAGAVTDTNKGTITSSGPINIDGDADVEWLTKISVPSVNMGNSNPVNITVNFPACAAGPNTNPVDYTATIDVCHAGDIAPLGLFGAGACGGASDGGQDRNTGNDAPVTRTIDDGSR